jgi:hypothetical protein
VTLILALLVTTVGPAVPTAEARQLFEKANEASYHQDYPVAKDSYLKLISMGFGGADVLFNLGTTALAEGDLGNAVFYLEKARRLEHREDVEENLALARSKQVDQVLGESGEPLVERWADSTSPNLAATLFLALWTFAFFSFVAFRFLPKAAKVWLVLSGMGTLALAGIFGSIVACQLYTRQVCREAVVLKAVLPIRGFPKESAKTTFEVHAGLTVRVLEESGNYWKIRLPNGLEGWAEQQALGVI